jgi:EmrB/QacA subfamily drug resistance transporter
MPVLVSRIRPVNATLDYIYTGGDAGRGESVAVARQRKWWVLLAGTGALGMTLIDHTVVSVALPRIQRDLDLSSTSVQWVVNAYTLALAVTVIVGGRLGDRFGHVRAFVLGIGVFTGASVVCGAAPNEAVIIAARAVQGLGAALMSPAGSALVVEAFSLEERGKAMAVTSGAATVLLAIGPLVGGAFVQFASWHWIFWIDVPIAVTTVALILAAHHPNQQAVSLPIVPLDVGLLVLGGATLVIGLQQSSAWGVTAPVTWAAIGGGAAVLGLFLVRQVGSKAPLLDLSLFRSRPFAADNIIQFCVQFVLIIQIVYGALYLQNVLGMSPFLAGVGLLPLMLPAALMAQAAGRAFDRVGVRIPTVLGTVLITGGMLFQAAVLGVTNYVWLVPGLVLMSLGIGCVMSPTGTDALNRAPATDRGEASAVLQTFGQLGGTIGLAIAGALVSGLEHSGIGALALRAGGSPDVAARLQGVLSKALADQIAVVSALGPDAQQLLAAVREVAAHSIAGAYVLAGIVAAVAVVVAIVLLPRGRQAQ